MAEWIGELGQVSLHVRDIATAQDFYGTVLGLTHLYTFGDLAFFDCAGTRLYLQATQDWTPGSVLYFRVDDLPSTYERLRDAGVHFTDAPQLIHRHESGVEEWMAFFTDPDGNQLALMAQSTPARDG